MLATDSRPDRREALVNDTGSELVIERHLDQPVAVVHRMLLQDAPLAPGTRVDCGTDGSLVVDGVLRAVVVAGASTPASTRVWCASGHLLARGRRLADVDIELDGAEPEGSRTRLVLRPRHRHPQRWRAGRRRRYVGVASTCADELCAALARGACPDGGLVPSPLERTS
jgi:hypothetical protein